MFVFFHRTEPHSIGSALKNIINPFHAIGLLLYPLKTEKVPKN